MIYGIAPHWRGRDLASRAARLAAHWALSLPGVTAVELRIGHDHTASQHVANNAGFAVAGAVTQFVPRIVRSGAPGQYEDGGKAGNTPGPGAGGAARMDGRYHDG